MAKIQQFVGNSVVKTAARLRKLTHELHSCLPAQFIGNSQVAEASEHGLTIAVSSPAWSHQMRYYMPLLRQRFNHERIRIIVCPEMVGVFQRSQGEVKTPKRLSSAVSQSLEATAQSIQDPKLKEAMLRLAQHGPKTKPDQN